MEYSSGTRSSARVGAHRPRACSGGGWLEEDGQTRDKNKEKKRCENYIENGHLKEKVAHSVRHFLTLSLSLIWLRMGVREIWGIGDSGELGDMGRAFSLAFGDFGQKVSCWFVRALFVRFSFGKT